MAFSKVTVEKTYSTQRVENDASARPPNLSSASCDLDVWPSDRQSWSLHAPWTICANLYQNRFIRFQNIVFKSLVTDERTDRQVENNILPPVSLVWRRHKTLQCTWNVSCERCRHKHEMTCCSNSTRHRLCLHKHTSEAYRPTSLRRCRPRV